MSNDGVWIKSESEVEGLLDVCGFVVEAVESFSSRYSLKSSLNGLQRPTTCRRKLIECFFKKLKQ